MVSEMYAESQDWNHGELYVIMNHSGGFQKYIDYLAYGPKDVRERHGNDMSKSDAALDIRLNTLVTTVEYDASRYTFCLLIVFPLLRDAYYIRIRIRMCIKSTFCILHRLCLCSAYVQAE